LPIHGTVDVGLSADVLFDSVDALTATQISSPANACPPPPSCGGGLAASVSDNGASAPGGGVTVTKQQNVGPYATVQLHTTDPMALNAWLSQNGFEIPADVQPVVDEYVKEQFDFLAMKLLPGQGIQAMRPVRVTSQGASLSLPLRMAAIGTGATVGITIWVVSDGRYEPQNFPFFHINDSDLVWDWSTSSSNYTTLRAQNAAQFGGKGWELESSLSLAEQLIGSVVMSGGQYYGGGGGVAGQPSDASQDYLPVTDSSGSITQTADQVRAADVAALFAGLAGPNVRVTRMRSDISHAAMTTDFVLQASVDQSEIPNVRTVTRSINLTCPIYGGNCSIIGYGPPDQAGGGGSGSSGCSTSGTPGQLPIGLGAVAAMIGLAIVRARRRAHS
jgi:MYXO-CTERM domain-containing protein